AGLVGAGTGGELVAVGGVADVVAGVDHLTGHRVREGLDPVGVAVVLADEVGARTQVVEGVVAGGVGAGGGLGVAGIRHAVAVILVEVDGPAGGVLAVAADRAVALVVDVLRTGLVDQLEVAEVIAGLVGAGTGGELVAVGGVADVVAGVDHLTGHRV